MFVRLMFFLLWQYAVRGLQNDSGGCRVGSR